MPEIVPTIIAKDTREFEDLVRRYEPYVARVSLDIMDGIFVPNNTISGYKEISQINTQVSFDAHLMVSNPEYQLDKWLETKVERIFIHIESSDNLVPSFIKIRQSNKKSGIVLNPETPSEKLSDYLEYVDFVQFMTVEPGFYGSMFIEEIIDKIAEFHMQYPQVVLAADGGITPENAQRLTSAGISILNIGSYLKDCKDIGLALKTLQHV